jgi:23S rRNA (cytidine1920-2'-O)/16S rRNA (cytidine1409-2'-O)-methyltransferase
LVERGMAESRSAARRAIDEGRVRVDGVSEPKAATLVLTTQTVTLAGDEPAWASRAGEKLDAALRRFGVDASDANALDVGASSGGFTDVLLHHGAARVVALDVGYGQLAWHLRQDPRVEVVERTNFRLVDPDTIGAPFDVIVMDVSFIGVSLLAPNLAAAGRPGTVVVVLVKPQFEVGRDRVGRGGVVSDPEAHRDAVRSAADALGASGIGVLAVMSSPILGSKGNREFLLHAVRGAEGREPDDIAAEAVP